MESRRRTSAQIEETNKKHLKDRHERVKRCRESGSRMIPLTRGEFTIVDAEDFDLSMGYKWYAQWNPPGKSFYAKTWKVGLIHRFLLGLSSDDLLLLVDHKNRDTLDNRRSNIHVVTCVENNLNRKDQSRYGAYIYRDVNLWSKPFHFKVPPGSDLRHSGHYSTAEEARQARQEIVDDLKKG